MNWGTCKKCGNPLDMYYKKWCPLCEKEELHSIKYINIIKALKSMESLELCNYQQSWNEIIEWFEYPKNDSYIVFDVAKNVKNNDYCKSLMIFIKEYNLYNKRILLEFSW